MSGFLGKNVGLNVGFFELPDIPRCRKISRLQAKCRVCRVLSGVDCSPLGPILPREDWGQRAI